MVLPITGSQRLHSRIVLLLIVGSILESSLQSILLLFLRNDLLKSGCLSNLIRILLGAELHQCCLVDSLQSRHVGVLGGSLEYVAASICRMSDSLASEFARIVPSVCKLLSTMPSPKSLVAACEAIIRWLSDELFDKWICGRDIDCGCLIAQNHTEPGIGRIHPTLHIAVCVARGYILHIVQGVA